MKTDLGFLAYLSRVTGFDEDDRQYFRAKMEEWEWGDEIDRHWIPDALAKQIREGGVAAAWQYTLGGTDSEYSAFMQRLLTAYVEKLEAIYYHPEKPWIPKSKKS